MTYSDLARRIGRSRNYVWSLFNEPQRVPSLPVALAIEDAVAIPPRAWVERRERAGC